MKHIINISLLMLLPYCAISQVEVRKITNTTFQNYLPVSVNNNTTANFVNPNAIPIITLNFTAPPILPYGVPETLNIDSTYDDLDDSTYEYSPKLEYGVPIGTNISISNGAWQFINGTNIWRIKIAVNNALNTGINLDNFNLSPSSTGASVLPQAVHL